MTFGGFVIQTRRLGPGEKKREKSDFAPSAVDILCIAGETLVGAVAGSDWVVITNFKNGTAIEGALPTVQKVPVASVEAPLIGCVHWQEGTKTVGKKLWVRVYGRHQYANTDGTTDVAAGDMLRGHNATSGAVETTTDKGTHVGFALADRTTNSIAGNDTWINNPQRIPLA